VILPVILSGAESGVAEALRTAGVRAGHVDKSTSLRE
jgi:hypothetical protein